MLDKPDLKLNTGFAGKLNPLAAAAPAAVPAAACGSILLLLLLAGLLLPLPAAQLNCLEAPLAPPAPPLGFALPPTLDAVIAPLPEPPLLPLLLPLLLLLPPAAPLLLRPSPCGSACCCCCPCCCMVWYTERACATMDAGSAALAGSSRVLPSLASWRKACRGFQTGFRVSRQQGFSRYSNAARLHVAWLVNRLHTLPLASSC
jgi:hypothetical protein